MWPLGLLGGPFSVEELLKQPILSQAQTSAAPGAAEPLRMAMGDLRLSFGRLGTGVEVRERVTGDSGLSARVGL